MEYKAGDKIRRIKDFHEGAPDSMFVTHLVEAPDERFKVMYWSAKADKRCFEPAQWELVGPEIHNQYQIY